LRQSTGSRQANERTDGCAWPAPDDSRNEELLLVFATGTVREHFSSRR
jgi:hypothetical protein